MTLTKNLLISLFVATLLFGCSSDKQTIDENTLPIQQLESQSTNNQTLQHSATESGHKANTADKVKQTSSKNISKPLDLSWKADMPAPQIQEHHVLPNLFGEKKPEKKRASVGGKVYRNDDPTMPLMHSVEGAEVSIKVLVP